MEARCHARDCEALEVLSDDGLNVKRTKNVSSGWPEVRAISTHPLLARLVAAASRQSPPAVGNRRGTGWGGTGARGHHGLPGGRKEAPMKGRYLEVTLRATDELEL